MLAIPFLNTQASSSRREEVPCGQSTTTLMLSAFLATVLLLTASPAGRADLLDGLIGYWPFNGDGADLSGGGYDLDLYGGVGFADGLYGQALDLHHHGSQFAQRPVDDAIYNFGGTDFTIQVWVNFNTTWGEQTVIEKFQGGGGPGWTLTKTGFDGDRWHFYGQPSALFYSDPQQIPTGVWHQVILRRTGNVFELFYDGVLVASDVNQNPIPDTFSPLLVGKRNDADGRDFSVDGRIDEVGIWGRALTDDEIVSLWNDGNGMPLL